MRLRGRDFPFAFLEFTHSSMENFSFGSLSHFRILLLPIGSISRATFNQWAAEIRTFETLRLSDIPPGTKDEKGEHTPPPRPYTSKSSPHSAIYAQPQVKGLFAPMLPDPPPISVALWHVALPAISFPAWSYRHCKLFTGGFPLLYHRRI